MQISGISTITQSTTGRPATPPESKTANPSTSAAVPRPAPAATFTSSVDGASPPAPASKSASAAASSLAQIQTAVSSSEAAMLATSFSTTVAGKTYSRTVQESGGTYVASVPLPPGASASGSSAQSAENNLDATLDALA